MLDTHTHILWNIDDGSKNQCMSLQMLEIAARSGTKAIFATPHVIERANKPSWEEIKEKTQQLRQLCAEAQIDIMLYPGAEVQMNWELLPELGAAGAYCLNGGRYLLVELPAAEDMLPLAIQLLAAGKTVAVEHAEPVYLRNEVAWKKLPGRE